MLAEASIFPWGHDAFSPLCQIFPYFREIFRLCGKFPEFYLFPKIFSIFIRQNFWWIFEFLLYFPCFSTFPLCFAKIIISPLLWQIYPPVLEKFTCCLHTLCVFRFPPSLTMMHLCITQCTYWTPLHVGNSVVTRLIIKLLSITK